LLEYSGTLLLVSHDRAFLNNLVTNTLVLDGSGQVREYVGGYDDWLRQRQEEISEKTEEKTSKPTVSNQSHQPQPSPNTVRKLSFKEKRELEELPGRIENLEAEHARLTNALGDPTFYQRDNTEISNAVSRLKELEEELARAYQRWEELEQIALF